MSNFWASLSKAEMGDAILTGFKGDFEQMEVYQPIKKIMSGGGSVLDFGAGVGRNTNYLKDVYDTVVAYDYDNMLKEFPISFCADNVELNPVWNAVKAKRFDECLASLVFQHIQTEELRSYLNDLSKMVSKLVVHSRTWKDFDKADVLDLIKEYFNVDNIEYQRDPNGSTNDHFIAECSPILVDDESSQFVRSLLTKI